MTPLLRPFDTRKFVNKDGTPPDRKINALLDVHSIYPPTMLNREDETTIYADTDSIKGDNNPTLKDFQKYYDLKKLEEQICRGDCTVEISPKQKRIDLARRLINTKFGRLKK